jgi:hypothetical protein
MHIDRDEMRAIRREWINHYLHLCFFANHPPNADEIKVWVRRAEVENLGQELKAYA